MPVQYSILMKSRAEFPNCADQYKQMLWIDIRCYAVPEVEYVAFSPAKTAQCMAYFVFDDRGFGQ